ncbi:MAG: hypothetical protein ACRCZP_12070, partial [Phycicoccus sp.]
MTTPSRRTVLRSAAGIGGAVMLTDTTQAGAAPSHVATTAPPPGPAGLSASMTITSDPQVRTMILVVPVALTEQDRVAERLRVVNERLARQSWFRCGTVFTQDGPPPANPVVTVQDGLGRVVEYLQLDKEPGDAAFRQLRSVVSTTTAGNARPREYVVAYQAQADRSGED